MKLWISDGHDGWEVDAPTPTKAIDEAIKGGDYTPPDGMWSYERVFEVSQLDEHGDIGPTLARRRVVFHPDEPMCSKGREHHQWVFERKDAALAFDRCPHCGRMRERDYAAINSDWREMNEVAYRYPPKEER